MTEEKKFRQAVLVWVLFITINVLLNGTIPFLLGRDLHSWTVSPIKSLLFNLIQYSLVFLVIPLILTKGWETVRQPGFLLPLVMIIAALALRSLWRPIAALSVFGLAYLHLRYDLSELGFRSRSWRTDFIVVLILALLLASQRFFNSQPFVFHMGEALRTGLDRLFLNPASTTEYIFYFGFLAERLSYQLGRWWTALLIGLMYTVHEMTNPEYWYGSMFFPVIFIGIVLFTLFYLWRRNVIAIWLGDGLGWFLRRLF